MSVVRNIDLAHARSFRLGSLLVEPALRQVTAEVAETLEPRVMQVLVALADAAGAIVSRDDLVSRCWNGRIVGDDAINRVIGRLRKLAAEHGSDGFRIETIPRVGYRLFGDVVAESRGLSPTGVADETVGQTASGTAVDTADRQQPPVPAAIALRKITVLCGRGPEQALLRSAWADAAAGHGRVVLLGGEPGIGKSFLATEIAQVAHSEGATVLYGHCDENVPVPYRPFIEIFQHAIAHAHKTVVTRHVEQHQGELARLIPELRARVPDLPELRSAEPDAGRFMLFEAASHFLAQMTTQAPVMVVLDDLHWAGASDLRLFRHLVRAAATLPMLVVATFQDRATTSDHPLTPLLADLRREDHISRCTLTGLDEAAIVALLAAYTKHPADAQGRALAAAFYRETSGNPFFIFELLRQLTEIELFTKGPDGWAFHGDVDALGLPDGIREVISRRLLRLSSEVNTVLGWAAVIGRRFALPMLELILAGTEHGGDRVLHAIEMAVATGLVVEEPGERERYRFHHSLVRQTLYDRIGGTRRRRMHRHIAETFEALASGDSAKYIDELAAHWAAGATSGDVDKAVDYARRAGRKATAGLAFEAAATHYARAIEAVTESGEPHEILCCDLWLELGNAQRNAGDARFRQTMASAAGVARRLGDADRLGHAALGSCHPGGLQWSADVDAQLVALYSEALAMLKGRDDPLVIQLLGLLAVELRFGTERARAKRLSAQALAMAHRGDDLATLARAVSAHLFVIDDPSSVAERLDLTARLETLADVLNDVELGCLAAKQRFDALLASADIEAAELALVRCERRAAKLGVPFYAVLSQVQRVMFAMLRGDADAEARAVAAFEAGTRIQLPHSPLIFNTHMLEFRTRRGQLDQVIPLIRATVTALPLLRPIRASLAHALCEVGEMTQAQATLDELVTPGLDWPIDTTWAATVHLTAEACAALGDRRVAGHFYPLVLPFLDQVGVATGMRCDGALAHPAGQFATCLADYDAAEAHFTAALKINERIGARVAAIHTRRAHAAMLIARGRAKDRLRALDLIAVGEASADALDIPAATVRFAKLREALVT